LVLFGDLTPPKSVHTLLFFGENFEEQWSIKRLNLPLEIRMLVTYSYIRKLNFKKIKN
jgi:hypothetical protein